MNKNTRIVATVGALYFRDSVGANASVCPKQNKNNIGTFDKHKSDVVGGDAFVRLEKNQNKNYIKTFDRLKSNVVGVGVPDDPNAKNKHTNKTMSNIPTSNVKCLTSNTAITLVALVITIVVLLILAGITLTLVMGENGIFGKANKAKEETQKTTVEETIKLGVLENNTKEAAGEASLNETELKAEIAKKLIELGFSVAEDNNVVTYYDDKTIKIDDYLKIDKQKEEKKLTEITAKDVEEHPDLYYGESVSYISKNGEDNWKIFYSDGEHIFLIASNYIDVRDSTGKINNEKISTNTKLTMVSEKISRVYWNFNNMPGFQTIDDSLKTRFKINDKTLDEKFYCSKCVSTLLNSNNWETYKDNNGKAEYAIGGSTIEMWIDSWNNKYQNEKLYYNIDDEHGYCIGLTNSTTDKYLDNSIMNQKTGYSDKLYYPYNDSSSDDTQFYWLSSCSKEGGDIISVCFNGFIGGKVYDDGKVGIRPVVSLNKDATIDIKK